MLHAKSLLNGFLQELVFSHGHIGKITNEFPIRKLKIPLRLGALTSRRRVCAIVATQNAAGTPALPGSPQKAARVFGPRRCSLFLRRACVTRRNT
jgi:hypothetical protein